MKKKIGITLAVVMLLVCIISVACLAGCKEKQAGRQAQRCQVSVIDVLYVHILFLFIQVRIVFAV